jgi:hypothetical protein
MGSPKEDDKQSKREMEQRENETEMIEGKRKEKSVHAFSLPLVQLPRLNTTPPLE